MANKPSLEMLKPFLAEASEFGYAAESFDSIDQNDGSHTISYKSKDWQYNDNYFGGEPYGGREVVHYKGNPFWINLYYGWVENTDKRPFEIYNFLRKAMRSDNNEVLVRGPREFKEGKMLYKNSWQGNLANFSGEEIIYENQQRIYRARYFGGLVDQ